jgi:hypothetical protein
MPTVLRKTEDLYKAGRFASTLSVVITDLANNLTLTESSSNFKATSDCAVFENRVEVKQSKIDRHTVQGYNRNYRFSLDRNKPNTSWLITDLVPSSTDISSDIVKFVDRQRNSLASFATTIATLDGDTYLPTLFEKPEFKIESVSQTGDNIEAVFSYKHIVEESKGGGVIQTRMTFAPQLGWVPIQWTEVLKSPAGERSSTTFREISRTSSGYSIQTIANIKESLISSKIHVKRTVQFDVSIPNSIPDADFRLTAYGLVEPPGFESKTPLYIWFLAVAGGCFVLFLSFRLFARRTGRSVVSRVL